MLTWWRTNGGSFPAWALAARIVFASSPNSASCERVFALLRNLFGELQMSSLADYVQAPGGADAQLQPTQRGVSWGELGRVVGAGGAHVCAKRKFQFSIKILFKIRGRRREIWGSK